MNHYTINTWEDFLEAKDYLDNYDSDILAFDVETDGVQEKTAKLFGLGMCLEDHEAFYFPWRKNTINKDFWWDLGQRQIIQDWVIGLFTSKKLIAHNGIYDILVLYHNWGIDLTDSLYSDTILLKHLLDEERPFGLKEVAVKYLGEWANLAQKNLYDNIKKNGGKTTKENTEMWKADTEILSTYCSWDVLLTRKLFDMFEPRIYAEGLADLFYKDEIMPLYKEVTIPMKKQGFPVDVVYFEKLNQDIAIDIKKLEEEIQTDIRDVVSEFVEQTLNTNYPVKTTGSFPKMYAEVIGFKLPEKNGKITLASKELTKLNPETREDELFLNWIRNNGECVRSRQIQRHWHQKDCPGEYIFNLGSNNHLKWLFFEKLGEEALSKTDGGEPQVDEDFLDSVKDKYLWVQKLIDLKKLNKLKSTYIEGILELQIEGVLYASFLMFGTTSGRFSCTGPNLQNLPRVKEDDAGLSETVLKYVNSIKKGFIAGKGKLLVNADYSQLEPRAFAEACGDKLLQDVFHKGEDLYGSIARNIWKLDCTANEVKKKYPEKRQASKVVALACVYGAEAGRISQLMGIDYTAADTIIKDYLNAYPGLKSYMSVCNKTVCTTGQIKTKLGRVRHLPEAKVLYDKFGLKLLDKKWAKSKGIDEFRWKFKNMLNLSKNFPIQGIAAHIVNRAMIAVNRELKRQNVAAVIIATVHDEVCCLSKAEDAEKAKIIVKECMENTVKLEVPLKAEPLIAENWADAK